jgi:hypothetical protein
MQLVAMWTAVPEKLDNLYIIIALRGLRALKNGVIAPLNDFGANAKGRKTYTDE